MSPVDRIYTNNDLIWSKCRIVILVDKFICIPTNYLHTHDKSLVNLITYDNPIKIVPCGRISWPTLRFEKIDMTNAHCKTK